MKSEAIRAGLLLFLASVLLVAAFQYPSDIFLDLGPNDHAYVTGFREEFEIDEPTLIHWTRTRSQIRLPFILSDRPFTVSFRYKRHMELPAEIRVFVANEMVDRFVARQQDFAVRTVAVRSSPKPWSPLVVGLFSTSQDPRPLGLALDWIQIRPTGLVLPTLGASLGLLVVILTSYLFPRLTGFSPRIASALALASAIGLGLWALFDKLAPVHAASTLGVRSLFGFLLLGMFFLYRRRIPGSAFQVPEARWALLAVLVGTSLRLSGLFHPDFFYPDVRTHSKFVSLIWTEGLHGFFADHIANQHRNLLGLQLVGDRWVAFPYPPLMYLVVYPLSRLQLPVDEWMKLVPTLLVGVESLVVFAIARHLGGSGRMAAVASWLHATAPLIAFRLTVASYAALFGHFWDTLVALYLLLFFEKMERPRVGLGLALLVVAALLSYAGSALVLGLFVPAFSVSMLLRNRSPKDIQRAFTTMLWALAGAIAAVVLFYIQYIPELMPFGVSDGGAGPSAGSLLDLHLTPVAALKMAAHRVDLFYGPFYGLLVFIGLPWARKAFTSRLTFPLSLGTLIAFFGLNFLRSGLGATHIFQFTKDDLVLLPYACLVLAALITASWSRNRVWRWVGYGLFAAWMIWGCVAMVQNVQGRILRLDYPPGVSQSEYPQEKLLLAGGPRSRSNMGCSTPRSAWAAERSLCRGIDTCTRSSSPA